MSAPERSNEPQAPQGASEYAKPSLGGFGQFAAKYRARWAMNHPKTRQRWFVDSQSEPLALPISAPGLEHESEAGTPRGDTIRRDA